MAPVRGFSQGDGCDLLEVIGDVWMAHAVAQRKMAWLGGTLISLASVSSCSASGALVDLPKTVM